MNEKNLPAAPVAGLDYSNADVIRTIKETVAVGATDAELAMFIELCKSTGLNPYKREIWFIKTPGYTRKDGTKTDPKVQIMTGVAGFMAIANSHPQYDGMECVVEREKTGKPIKAIATVHRKDRKFPSVAEALWCEDSQPTVSAYGKDTIWGKMPSVMLSKVAKSRALREAFPQQLNGLEAAEEMPVEYALDEPPTFEKVRVEASGQLIVAETNPDQYQLEAPLSMNRGKTLDEIHRANPEWLHAVLHDEKKRGALTQRDLVNIEAFAAVMIADKKEVA